MFKKFQKGGQLAYELIVPKIKKNLTKRRADFEDLVKTTDKYKKKLTGEGKIKVSEAVQPAAKRISAIHDKYDKKLGPGSSNPKAKTEKKAKGGRVGLKRGSDLGMQSVKYGLDNNPKITAADPKAKFIAANKKKKKKFESPMAKAIKKKNKKRII
tara:strand:+ start:30 stop:497 length:468 start_codon:yes stop_codon:yes gene_type:complete